MYLNGVRGLLSKREIELIERDRYNKSEYSKDYRDVWCYGDERVEEIHSEWNSLNDGFLFEDYNN